MTWKPVPDQLVVGGVPAGRLFRLYRHSRIQVLPHAFMALREAPITSWAKDRISTCAACSPTSTILATAGVYSLNDNSGLNLLNGAGGLPSFNNSIRPSSLYHREPGVGRGSTYLPVRWFAWDRFPVPSPAEKRLTATVAVSFGIPNQSTFGTSPCTYDPVATGNSLTPRWSQSVLTRRPTTLLFTP